MLTCLRGEKPSLSRTKGKKEGTSLSEGLPVAPAHVWAAASRLEEAVCKGTTSVHVGESNPEVLGQPIRPEAKGGLDCPVLLGGNLPGIAPGWLSESSLHAGETAV